QAPRTPGGVRVRRCGASDWPVSAAADPDAGSTGAAPAVSATAPESGTGSVVTDTAVAASTGSGSTAATTAPPDFARLARLDGAFAVPVARVRRRVGGGLSAAGSASPVAGAASGVVTPSD
ncbi:hypothetical protein MXD58_019925, partial [Frankia sp. AgKG'84/4]|nr:hypothetical protein [Frankia sp. AgKG'84/4]